MEQKAQFVENAVKDLYGAQHPGRDPWAEWLWEHHVTWVADKAVQIADSKQGDRDLVRVAALLHDVADSVMNRFIPAHEKRSLEIAEDLLNKAGYDESTVRLIVDDMLAKHSCRGDERPESLEGKIMATADALAHFQTSFFAHAFWWKGTNNEDYEKIMDWALKKVEKDFNNKIFFEDIKFEIKPAYESLKVLFTV